MEGVGAHLPPKPDQTRLRRQLRHRLPPRSHLGRHCKQEGGGEKGEGKKINSINRPTSAAVLATTHARARTRPEGGRTAGLIGPVDALAKHGANRVRINNLEKVLLGPPVLRSAGRRQNGSSGNCVSQSMTLHNPKHDIAQPLGAGGGAHLST